MVNGPEPTTSLSAANLAASCFSQMCLGTIGISWPGLGAWADFSVMTTVCGSVALTSEMLVTSPPLAACSAVVSMIEVYVYATSSAVIALPSDHLRSSGMWNVQVLPSSLVSHLSAIPASGSLFLP